MKYLLVLAAAVAACATAATVLGTSAGGDEILFPHARHKQANVDCITCHEPVWDAKTLAGDFLPNEAKCLECHKAKKAAGECAMCHSDVRHAGPWPKRPPRLNFDHAAHLDRVKEDCSVCHKQLAEPRKPVMITAGHAACLTFHNHSKQYDDAQCTNCHLDLASYPLVPVTEVSHQGDFLRRHGNVARASGKSCAACHEQNFCLDCHAEKTVMVPVETRLVDRPDRRFIHRQDFLGRHSIDARSDPALCQRCHAVSSCETCHQHERISAGASARNPHPPGWVLPGSPQFHGTEARRNISSCAACHDQGEQSNCVSCHKVGGIGGDPHPAGFRTRHDINEARNDGRCVACHF